MVVSGYDDTLNWRSLQWAMREQVEQFPLWQWKRSGEDLFNLWFRREEYVRKYYPELLNG
jgi:hypothetical protein